MKNLLDIWKEQPKGYLAVSSKTGKIWHDYFFKSLPEVNKWIQDNRKNSDLYFCTTTLKNPKRDKNNVQSSRYLWQDLDLVDPRKLPDKLKPTIAWLSSPGRYQALWKLNTLYSATDIETLNKKLAQTVKADKGSWILTKVLRIPGTLNFKYAAKPEVKLLWLDGPEYTYKGLEEQLTGSRREGKNSLESLNLIDNTTKLDYKRILRKYWNQFPRKVQELLYIKKLPPIGKRSDTLWYLEHELMKVGLSIPEIKTLIQNSNWNKYKGRSDEEVRLNEEISKVYGEELDKEEQKEQRKQKKKEQKEQTDEEDDEELPLVSLKVENDSELLSNLSHYPGWLVEGFWTRKSHGIVSGEPKAFKSTLVLDLAISVASGKPFLNKFQVIERGPVLVVQNENAGWIMKDRVVKIKAHKGLLGKISYSKDTISAVWPKELPIYYVNQQGFSFSDPVHRDILEQLLETTKPKLAIFDPLYLMFEGDISQSKDLSPILSWLLAIKEKYNTSILLIHHWKKGTQGTNIRSGQRMLGSVTLHGWVESAWYLEIHGQPESDIDSSVNIIENDDNDTDESEENEAKTDMTEELNTPGANISLTLEREFRGAGTYPKMDLNIGMGDFGSLDYSVEITKHIPQAKKKGSKPSREDLKHEIIHILGMKKGPVPVRMLAESIGVSRKKASALLKEIYEERQQELPEVIN